MPISQHDQQNQSVSRPCSPVPAPQWLWFLRPSQVSIEAPSRPQKHRLSTDGTGKFYLDFQLVQRSLDPLPCCRPPSPCPLPGEHSGYSDISLESLAPSLLTYPSPPAQRKEGCGERAWKIWIRMAHSTDSGVHCHQLPKAPGRLKVRGGFIVGSSLPQEALTSAWGPSLPLPCLSEGTTLR